MTLTLSPVLWMSPLSSGNTCLSQGLCSTQPVRSHQDTAGVGFLWCRLRQLHPSINHSKIQIPVQPEAAKPKITFFTQPIGPAGANRSLEHRGAGTTAPAQLDCLGYKPLAGLMLSASSSPWPRSCVKSRASTRRRADQGHGGAGQNMQCLGVRGNAGSSATPPMLWRGCGQRGQGWSCPSGVPTPSPCFTNPPVPSSIVAPGS